jgi:hypothetical protein
MPETTGPCRLCGVTSYGGDDDGPVHACCQAWRKVIAAGYRCPSCQIAESVLRQMAEMAAPGSRKRSVRLPLLAPLPTTLPDGSLFVPEVSITETRAADVWLVT